MKIENGAIYTLLEAVHTKIDQIAAGPQVSEPSGVAKAVVGAQVEFAVTFTDGSGQLVPLSAITPGVHSVVRVRGNQYATIVDAAASSEAPGRVFFTYDFPDGQWLLGDIFYVEFNGMSVEQGGNTTLIPVTRKWGRIAEAADIDSVAGSIYNIVAHGVYGNEALQATLADILNDTITILADTGVEIPAVLQTIDGRLTNASTGLSAIKTAVDTKASTSHVTDKHATTDGLINAISTLVQAIKTKTDSLAFTSGTVNANISSGVTVAANGLGASSIQTDAITAAKLATDAITKIQNGLATISDLNTRFGASLVNVRDRVTDALNLAVTSPTAGSLRDIMTDGTGATWNRATHSLQAIGRRLEVMEGMQSPNLVKDPSCETLSNFGSVGGAVSHETTATRVRSATKSLAFTGKLVISLWEPVRSNAQYLLEYWVHDPSNAISQVANYVTWPGGEGFNTQLIVAPSGYSTGQWKRVRNILNIPTLSSGYPSAATMTLDFQNGATTVYIDDISLREIGGSAAGRGEYWPDVRTGTLAFSSGAPSTTLEFTDTVPFRLGNGFIYVAAGDGANGTLTITQTVQITSGGAWRSSYYYEGAPANTSYIALPLRPIFNLPTASAGYPSHNALQDAFIHGVRWVIESDTNGSVYHTVDYSLCLHRKAR